MTNLRKFVALSLVALSPLAAPFAAATDQAVVTPLMVKELADISGKEVTVLNVVYPPGSADPVHRHNAHGFIYVLEGTIVMQVRGGKQVVLTPGQMFYEGPDDVHTVGRNASNVMPAKFLVFLLKNKGAEVLIPTT
jgi:quercetin dioxygenase-like cupin family protein